MRNFHLRKNHSHCSSVNVDRLWALSSGKISQDEKVPVVNVINLGYYKVVGKGKLPKQPFIVKAKAFSHSAEQKIKKAGGACILVA